MLQALPLRMSLKGLYGEIRMNSMWYNWITNKK
jgi:hypothetical protein